MFRMRIRSSSTNRPAAVASVLALVFTVWGAAAAGGAGFLIFEQGSKAMGMAGAFTAQADDGSAMFHNVAGLAFQDEVSYEVGVTLIQPSSEFQGLAPFPGPGNTAEQESSTFFPPHLYYVRPISDRLTFGFGFNTPFGLSTDWKDPESFSGRFISAEAELRSFDLNPSIGWKAGENFGVGIGLVARVSDVRLERFVPQINPFTQTATDVAFTQLESDFDTGIGWNVGVLHKVGKYLSWGFSYRSKIEIDYSGDGTFTQISTGNAQFDALVAAAIPFGQALPLETTIEFPDLASFGVALGLTRALTVEIDVNWAGWSSFGDVPARFHLGAAVQHSDPQRLGRRL